MIWAMVMPIIYLIIFILGYLAIVVAKILPYRVGIIYTSLIYMFLYLHPTLIGGYIARGGRVKNIFISFMAIVSAN